MTKDSLTPNPEHSIDLEEGVFPVDIEKAVKAGVKVFVMCYHGYGTSVSFAEVLRDAGIPATHIRRGTQQAFIDYLTSRKNPGYLDNFAHAPYLVFLPDDGDLKPAQRAMISLIKAKVEQGEGKFVRLKYTQAADFVKQYQA